MLNEWSYAGLRLIVSWYSLCSRGDSAESATKITLINSHVKTRRGLHASFTSDLFSLIFSIRYYIYNIGAHHAAGGISPTRTTVSPICITDAFCYDASTLACLALSY